MKLVYGDLWTYPAEWRVVTTNGTIKKDGSAVLGRGCAREAARKYPALPKALGQHLATKGNVLAVVPGLKLLCFPVKHQWWEPADLGLIAASVQQLCAFALHVAPAVVVLPRPGVGNGKRTWAEVAPLLENLPENVHVITWKEEEDGEKAH